jgi:hypothetical protein
MLLGYKPKMPLTIAVLGTAQHSVQEYLTQNGSKIAKFVNKCDNVNELYDFLRMKRVEAINFAVENIKNLYPELKNDELLYVEQRLLDWNLKFSLIESLALVNARTFYYSYEMPKTLMFEKEIEYVFETKINGRSETVRLYGHPDILILDPYSQTGLLFDYKTGEVAPLSEWVKPWEYLQLNIYSYILEHSKNLQVDIGCIIYTQLFGLPFYMRPVKLNKNVEKYIEWALQIKLGIEKIPVIRRNARCKECSLREMCPKI